MRQAGRLAAARRDPADARREVSHGARTLELAPCEQRALEIAVGLNVSLEEIACHVSDPGKGNCAAVGDRAPALGPREGAAAVASTSESRPCGLAALRSGRCSEAPPKGVVPDWSEEGLSPLHRRWESPLLPPTWRNGTFQSR